MNAASSTGAGRMEAEKLAQTRMNSIDTLPQAQDPTPALMARADHSRYVQRVRRVRDQVPYSTGEQMMLKPGSDWMVEGSPGKTLKAYNELVERSNNT